MGSAEDVVAAGHDPRSDDELLRAHVAGDTGAFGELFGRHRDRLWAVALRTMGDPDDAADGLQDGLVSAYRRADTFRGDARVTTWLHRVIVNACLDRLRAAKVRRTEALPDDVDAYGDRGALTITADDGADPADRVVRGDRRGRVLAALATLSPQQRAALVLVDMEGYSVAETAEILDCAEGTVKSRCSRGRARLAELLAPLLEADEETAPRAGNPAVPSDVPSRSAPRAPPDQTTP